MQWDYIVDWPGDEQPKLWIYAYRCFQWNHSSEEFREVDQIPFDVPVGMTSSVVSVSTPQACYIRLPLSSARLSL
jgi:hypothetical protein